MGEVCKICGSEPSYIFSGTILGKYTVRYYSCACCGFVQTERPYWLEEAYQRSINLSDTGLVQRNILASRSAAVLLFFVYGTRKKYLDYAGGYGLFTRLMRNYGFDFYSHDPYTDNLLARGFEYRAGDEIELVTTFESFEHFEHPIAEIEKILAISKHIFFSTHLIPDPAPAPDQWWYYGLDHGQHIAFYTRKTLRYIADKYGLHVYSLRGYHLLTTQKINKWWYRLLIGGGRYGLHQLVPLFMRSRVMKDMQTLKAGQHA
ncbi:class I SAM-dependent methyltransferase [Chitinophaga pendula]|uniref:class I SAM-dependent methyltransferase n=1 Tax=Chitinophaga TaxID=79328 RepID=UPI000BAFF345|nr:MULTISPECIES: class I SAM-dependent methyltransferase [Chitinophaga]ASZ14197.1 methyltransferase type 11 [Chitinophaga sp. MD30]UCJ08166.1 class I SAM-dependent methyltransferase [Chitinophaga pendula]